MKGVKCFNKDTGEEIFFPSVQQAAEFTHVGRQNIIGFMKIRGLKLPDKTPGVMLEHPLWVFEEHVEKPRIEFVSTSAGGKGHYAFASVHTACKEMGITLYKLTKVLKVTPVGDWSTEHVISESGEVFLVKLNTPFDPDGFEKSKRKTWR